MPNPNELEGIVQRMIDANEPEENIAAVIHEYGKVNTGAEQPSVGGFVKNIGTSAVNTAKDAVLGGMRLLSDPKHLADNLTAGMRDRARQYTSDMSGDTAIERLNAGHPLEALSNLLPVSLLYKDPVGVAADAYAVKGGVDAARGIAGIPNRIRDARSQAFNKLPLTKQMERLPQGGPSVGSGPASPVRPNPIDINSLPLHDQMSHLPQGGTSTPSPAPPVQAGPPSSLDLKEMPTWQQQQILEQAGGPNTTENALGRTTPEQSPPITPRAPGTVAPALSLDDTLTKLVQEQAQSAPAAGTSVMIPPPQDVTFQGTGRRIGPTMQEMRSSVGAESAAQNPAFQDAARETGIPATADSLRDLTGGPTRRPLKADAAEMDANYRRRIMDERGSTSTDFILEMLLGGLLGKTILRPSAVRLGASGIRAAAPYAGAAAQIGAGARFGQDTAPPQENGGGPTPPPQWGSQWLNPQHLPIGADGRPIRPILKSY